MTGHILPRHPTADTPPRLYTVVEASEITGVPASTLYDEMRAGRLKYMLPRGRSRGRRIEREWLDEWIREATK